MATLEQKFEQYKAVHKYVVLKCKIIQYYKALEANTVTVPDFQRRGQTPEDLADRDLRLMLASPEGLKEFNRLYELAYQDLAEVLDGE